MKRKLPSIIRNVSAVALAASVFFACTFDTGAELYVETYRIPTTANIKYDGTRLTEVIYETTTVWSFGADAVFNSNGGAKYTVHVTDFDTVDSVDPVTLYATPGDVNENTVFAGWALSKTGEICTDTALSETTNFYAVYTHHHTGDSSSMGGCHTKKVVTPGADCGGTLTYTPAKKGDIWDTDVGISTWPHTPGDPCPGSGDDVYVCRCSLHPTEHYKCVDTDGELGTTCWSTEDDVVTWEINCGKNEGDRITW